MNPSFKLLRIVVISLLIVVTANASECKDQLKICTDVAMIGAQIIQQQDLVISDQEKLIKVLQESTANLEKQLELARPSWYENKYLWFGVGILAGVVTTK